MARAIKDARLQTKAARGKLAVQTAPYYRQLQETVHIGYRKGKRAGKWVVRIYIDGGYLTETIGLADDQTDADGVKVFDFDQACEKARVRAQELEARHEGRRLGPYMLSDAIEDYLGHLKDDGRNIKGPSSSLGRVLKGIGDHDIRDLTIDIVKGWHKRIATEQPVSRSGKIREVDMTDPEVQRQRKDTANRLLSDLKAVLNRAYGEGHIKHDDAWRAVKAFKNVGEPRVRYLQHEEIRRLVNACPADVRALVQGALLTGARRGDLLTLRVSDFKPDAHAVMINNSKVSYKGKMPFPCYLQPDGMEFFKQLVLGRPSDDYMFLRADGQPWGEDDSTRPLKEACAAAKITPNAGMHVLRHTYASHAVMAGVPLMVVAANLGHSDTRMVEAHYKHLAPNYIKEQIGLMPSLTQAEPTTVVAIK